MGPSNHRSEELPNPPAPPKRVPRWVSAVVIIGFAAGCGSLMLPIWGGSNKASALRGAALSDAKQLGRATLIYAESTDDQLPIADHWMDEIDPLVKETMNFPAPGKQFGGLFCFAFRAKLSSAKIQTIDNPGQVALIFNSKDGSWNANGDLDLLPNPPEFSGKNVVCFVDGHGAFVPFAGVEVR